VAQLQDLDGLWMPQRLTAADRDLGDAVVAELPQHELDIGQRHLCPSRARRGVAVTAAHRAALGDLEVGQRGRSVDAERQAPASRVVFEQLQWAALQARQLVLQAGEQLALRLAAHLAAVAQVVTHEGEAVVIELDMHRLVGDEQ